ncbi:phosphoglycerate dehydrogenase [Bauldia sp.]|uniref:phosphoglycerate dehydrogenase n=1 Tax=Bauldia sp. TaxID=2575872 RepID=UPI003BAD484E
MTDRILVTPRSLTPVRHPLVERLSDAGFEVIYSTAGKLPSERELLTLIPGCVGWLAGIEPVSPAVIDAADRLEVIARNGTGIDNLPLDLLRQRGIALTIAQGANARGVAELTIALMLTSLRHITRADAGIKAGEWPRLLGREIADSVVGVVGCGAIGSSVARMAADLGATVIGSDPATPEVVLRDGRLTYTSVAELFARCTIGSLHCPLPDDGAAVVTREVLASMPDDAVLVNTARAGLVDEAAVLAALDSGRLAAYATDVFDPEPPVDLTLARHPKVVATSHIGALTRESVERTTRMAVDSLLAALRP